MDSINWIQAFALIALTVAFHTTGIALMTLLEIKVRLQWLEPRKTDVWQLTLIVSAFIAVIGLALAALHGMEVVAWAVVLERVGAVETSAAALLYSIDSMTTRGASGITVTANWLTFGALEAANGMLLFGISTAYIFAVLQAHLPMLSRALQAKWARDRSRLP